MPSEDLDPVPTPEPEKIIVVATATPENQDISSLNGGPASLEGDDGGCSGGGSSKISIFSVLISLMLVAIYKRSRKLKISSL